VAVGIGFVPALLCLLAAAPILASADFRAGHRQWRPLAVVSAASFVMLLVMATPPGWALFDWYVG
jgi:predicted Na+-dependent transporter